MSSNQQMSVSLNYGNSKLDEKPYVKNELILEEYSSETFNSVTNESKDIINRLIDGNEKCFPREDFIMGCNRIFQENEVISSSYQKSLSLDFEKQELNGKIDVEDDVISEKCSYEELQNVTMENKNINNEMIDENVTIFSRVANLIDCNRMSANVQNSEVFTINPEESVLLDVVKQELDEKPDERILKDYIDAEFTNFPADENKDIFDQQIEENSRDLPREDFPTDWNLDFIKTEKNEDFVPGIDSTHTFSEPVAEEPKEQQLEKWENDETSLRKNVNSSRFELASGDSLAREDSDRTEPKNRKRRQNRSRQDNVDFVHPKTKNHKCHLCDYSSTRKSCVERHVNSVHLKTKNHACHLCDYSTSKKNFLERHVDNVHLKVKNHACHLCDYSSSKKNYLKRHVDSVHLKVKNYVCHLCGYSSSQKVFLKGHIDSVHLKMKDYNCDFCDFSTSRKISLKEHLDSVHLKVKSHECHLCDYSTSRKRHLKLHVDSVHMKVKNVKCHLCDYSTTRKCHLKIHVDSVHLKVKNHKCHICDYSSSRKNNLKVHVNSVHLKMKKLTVA